VSERPKSIREANAVSASGHEGAFVVHAHQLERVYRSGPTEVAALRGASFRVERGTLTVLRGRSGSGKTTLLNIVGGLDKPTAGTVDVCEKPLAALNRRQLNDFRRHKIGFVFQSFALIPTFSAFENVDMMLRIAGLRKNRRQRAMGALAVVGLERWADHRPWEMSGGQQQRVSIARALVTRPELILADEPTGELDSTTGRQIMALFQQIAVRQGVSVLMATHDPNAADFADNVLHLSDGKIRTAH
jgi:ABC-type lipoprotein export system ATPase subunit